MVKGPSRACPGTWQWVRDSNPYVYISLWSEAGMRLNILVPEFSSICRAFENEIHICSLQNILYLLIVIRNCSKQLYIRRPCSMVTFYTHLCLLRKKFVERCLGHEHLYLGFKIF